MGNIVPINWVGEFVNKELEAQFRLEHLGKSKKLLKVLILLSGIVYFCLFFIDYFCLKSFHPSLPSFICRLGILLISIAIFIVFCVKKDFKYYTIFVTIYEILLILSYFYVIRNLYGQGYFQQGMVLVVLYFFIFFIPNRWIYSCFASVTALAVYIHIIPSYIDTLLFSEILEAVFYQVIVLVLMSVHMFRNNSLQRMQYFREGQLELLAVTDELTNIYNRKKFDESLDEWISIANRNNAVFSVIMYDLDKFKYLNDTYGHLAGDQVLIACADTVKANMRIRDIFARWGGEEFMILLPLTSLGKAVDLATRLRKKIAELRIKGSIPITASFGVTEYTSGETREAFLERLDKKMYEAKENGRNRVEF